MKNILIDVAVIFALCFFACVIISILLRILS